MTRGLFDDAAPEPFHRSLRGGGELTFDPGFLEAPHARVLLDDLASSVAWKDETILLFGRRVAQPRRTAWFGDEGAVYTYSGLTNEPTPFLSSLQTLRCKVEGRVGTSFNSVLLNLYRNGRDSMGLHADNEPELGTSPVIASVSLGAPRRFVLRYAKKDAVLPPVSVSLTHGSLLVMGGTLQHFWKHEVPKEPAIVEPRINLTFRRIVPRAAP